MIRVLQPRIRLDGTSLLALVGAPPARAVEWACSSGTIEAFTSYTDAHGRASAVWTPEEEGAATISVSFGA